MRDFFVSEIFYFQWYSHVELVILNGQIPFIKEYGGLGYSKRDIII